MSSAPSSACAPLRILAVENHDDTRDMLCRLLKRRGHGVFLATTMEEALQVLRAQKIDVLLSDIGLPDGDGWELLLRAKDTCPAYAIAISGYGTLADKNRSRDVGYRHHLVKPFTVVELDALLREAATEIERLR
jgi:CheY-like chemotaxis protein